MSNKNLSEDRDLVFRRVLVRSAQRSSARIRLSSFRNVALVAVAAIAVFALAGALTGGAVASASAESARQVTADATARFAALDVANRNDGKVVGSPILKSATKTLTLDPHAPAGANFYVLGFDCLDAGHFNVELTQFSSGSFDCTAAQAHSKEPVGNGSGGSLSGQKDIYVKVTSSTDARFTIWFAWINIPTLKPSTQEKQQIAGGTITRAGLLTALGRYSACMTALGYSVGPLSAAITPGFPSVPQAAITSGADHRCGLTEDNQVQNIWYLEIEKGTVAAASVTACLEQRHATPEATAASRAEQLAALDLNWQTDCAYVG
jgi:type II secretory pathway pseudopilin PulG